MNWQEILTILVPILGMLAWVYNRMDKRFDSVDRELDLTRSDIHNLDMRLSKLEGRFEERGYWEAREHRKTGTEDKK